MKQNRKITWITLALICCLVLAAVGLYLNMKPQQERVHVPDDHSSIVSVVEPEPEPDYGPENAAYYKKYFEDNRAINPDYIGTVFFDSNLINQPVVQCLDNSYYLRRNWQTLEYDEAGANFMDYECRNDSQNIIIYGHYAYPSYDPSRKLRFTPLAQLLQPENYEANKTVYLLLENEIREYVICSVYYTDLISSDGVYYTQYEEQYNLADFYEDYFSTYHDRVRSKQLYETGEDFSYADHLLTLQTCVENRPDQREIIVCRQVNTYPITDRCDFAMREMIDSERAG